MVTIFSQNVEFDENDNEITYYHFYERKPYFYGLYAMIFLFGILNQYFISRFYFQSKKETSHDTEDVEMAKLTKQDPQPKCLTSITVDVNDDNTIHKTELQVRVPQTIAPQQIFHCNYLSTRTYFRRN